jgi:enamine deaminase RidA (YjgF/YER057c/UK114 family)
MERKIYAAGGPWEEIIGYSRAVQVGNTLEISGTVSANESGVVGKGDFYAQTKFIFEKLKPVLENAGFSFDDVTRTRLFLTDITKWEEAGRAHGEFFRTVKPATSILEVSALISPDYLVEIEVTAVKAN